jgi:lipoprotein-anchoring transpeptidase ErfK/SrfK
MVYAGLVSSGLNRWPTYEGLFQVFSSYYQAKMSGAEGKVDYYFIEDVPYTMYFDRKNEIALHGAYWHDRYGYKHSHGCVNMPPRDAEWVYYWSDGAPNDLWVWVHTSEPMEYFRRLTDSGSLPETSS